MRSFREPNVTVSCLREPRGSGWSLVALTVFKTVRDLTTSGWVGSIPMHSRHASVAARARTALPMTISELSHRSIRRLAPLLVATGIARATLAAQRADSTRAAAAAAATAAGKRAAAADRAAPRVFLFVPRSGLLAGVLGRNKAASRVHARRGDQHRDDPRVRGGRARSASHCQRHSHRRVRRRHRGTSGATGRCASALQQRVRAHAIGARRGLGRAARRQPSLRRRRRVRRRAPVGRASADSAIRVLPRSGGTTVSASFKW